MYTYQRETYAIVSDHDTYEALEESGEWIAVDGGLWEVPA